MPETIDDVEEFADMMKMSPEDRDLYLVYLAATGIILEEPAPMNFEVVYGVVDPNNADQRSRYSQGWDSVYCLTILF